MRDGDRYQLKDLAQLVADQSGGQATNIIGFVDFFTHHTDMGYVSRGKKGGFIRGQKLIKPLKIGKLPASSDN